MNGQVIVEKFIQDILNKRPEVLSCTIHINIDQMWLTNINNTGFDIYEEMNYDSIEEYFSTLLSFGLKEDLVNTLNKEINRRHSPIKIKYRMSQHDNIETYEYKTEYIQDP